MTAIQTIVPVEGLRIKTVIVTGTPYVDCLNKDDSLLSLLKRCIVLQLDGTYALQINLI